jgi:hypothetical protein
MHLQFAQNIPEILHKNKLNADVFQEINCRPVEFSLAYMMAKFNSRRYKLITEKAALTFALFCYLFL